jgi:thioredoxin-related protein
MKSIQIFIFVLSFFFLACAKSSDNTEEVALEQFGKSKIIQELLVGCYLKSCLCKAMIALELILGITANV